MTLAELKAILDSTELPVAYNAWQVGAAPALPFIVYRQMGSNNFAADNIVYSGTKEIDVELYTKEKSPDTEAAVEDVLNGASIYWEKTETYLDDEKCFEVTYEIEV